jgi:hypothetical protein
MRRLYGGAGGLAASVRWQRRAAAAEMWKRLRLEDVFLFPACWCALAALLLERRERSYPHARLPGLPNRWYYSSVSIADSSSQHTFSLSLVTRRALRAWQRL